MLGGEQKGGETVNSKPEHEIIPKEEINLYDYWKVLVKRKKILIGIFLRSISDSNDYQFEPAALLQG